VGKNDAGQHRAVQNNPIVHWKIMKVGWKEKPNGNEIALLNTVYIFLTSGERS
jgi:hypothetical protein